MQISLLKSSKALSIFSQDFILSTSIFRLLHKKSPSSKYHCTHNYFNCKRNSTNWAKLKNRVCRYPVYSFSTSTNLSAMGDNNIGLPLKTVVEKLNSFASLSLAESWDNVGLLVEPTRPKQITKILLTNDLTEEVVKEAVELSVDLIISYHPPIFAPLKSVTTRTWKERVVATLIENRIALYSPHTSFDAVHGGVNDWLASAFDTKSVTPLTPVFNSSGSSHLVEVTLESTKAVEEFRNKLQSASRSGDESLATTTSTLSSGEVKLSVPCTATDVSKLAQIFNDTASGVSTDHFKVTQYEKTPIPGYGMGRMCLLKSPTAVEKVVELVKNLIKVPHLRLATAVGKDIKSPVSSIALCAGSGSSVLRGIKADLYLTGEMPFHDVLDSVHRGSHVILCNHSNSERGFLTPFSSKLSNDLLGGKVRVIVSKSDKDPLITV